MLRVLAVVLSLGSAAFAQDAGVVVLSLDGGEVDAGVIVPPTLVTPSPAEWPEDAGVTGGDVELMLTIDEHGAVTDVQVNATVGEPFTSAALFAARGLVFEPATRDGVPAAVVLAYRYRFEPPRVVEFDGGVRLDVGRLSGRVMTKGTREPVIAAQVSLEDGGVTAVETDADGRFVLELPPGPARVLVTASAHKPRVFTETVRAGQQVEVLYRLNRTYSRPYETIVRGQVDRAELSRITLSGAELREVAGTAGEPLRVVMLLPGVVTPASGISCCRRRS